MKFIELTSYSGLSKRLLLNINKIASIYSTERYNYEKKEYDNSATYIHKAVVGSKDCKYKDGILLFGGHKDIKEEYPVIAKCPICDYQFSEVIIYRCLVFSCEKQPEIKCVQCSEIYPISNLIKKEEKTNVDTVNNNE